MEIILNYTVSGGGESLIGAANRLLQSWTTYSNLSEILVSYWEQGGDGNEDKSAPSYED